MIIKYLLNIHMAIDEWRMTRIGKNQGRKGMQGEIPRLGGLGMTAGSANVQTPSAIHVSPTTGG
jgi:hypothetical protein